VQSLMRHANSNITMNIYTHAVSSKKRRAQSKVVEMILPAEIATPVSRASLDVYFLVYRADFPKVNQVLWKEWRGRRDSNSRPLP